MCFLPCRGHSFLSNTAVHQAHLEFMFSDISSENESYLCDYGFKTQQEGYYRPRLFLRPKAGLAQDFQVLNQFFELKT